MILQESTETRHRKIHVRIPKCPPKLIRIPREKSRERPEEICTVEAVRYVGPQPDAIHSSAHLPKVFAAPARVRVFSLIMIFAARTISCVGSPKVDQPSNIDLRAKRLVGAQNRMARGCLDA